MEIYGIKINKDSFIGFGDKKEVEALVKSEYGNEVDVEFIEKLDSFAEKRILEWYQRFEKYFDKKPFLFPYLDMPDPWIRKTQD